MAASVYDRIGRLQDTQAPIERAAVDRLVTAGVLRDARAVFELGCGTGALAHWLLSDVIPETATYIGGDVSPRMVALARRRVAAWSGRAEVLQLDGTLPLPGSDGSADRFIAAYVMDLLQAGYARQILRDAHRLVADGGLLCLSSLSQGRSLTAQAISNVWMGLWRLAPRMVGGCRPIELRELLEPGPGWEIRDDTVVEAWGVPSQVLIAAAVHH